MKKIADMVTVLNGQKELLDEVRIYGTHNGVELTHKEQSVNADSVRFMHALAEFGRHVATYVYRNTGRTPESRKVKRGIIACTDVFTNAFITSLYNDIDWINRPWCSEGMSVEEGVYSSLLVMTKNSKSMYTSTSLDACIIRTAMDCAIEVYFELLHTYRFSAQPNPIDHSTYDWFEVTKSPKPEYKAVLSRVAETSNMYDALHRAANIVIK